MENSGISKYISERMQQIQSERIMNAEEVLEHLTSIARRDVAKGSYKATETSNGQTIESEKEYEHVPSIEEQTRALELIGKRYALWVDKQQTQAIETPVFVDDITGDEDE